MDTYRLNDLKATVGMFGDLSEAITNDKGEFDEDLAKDLCMDCLDGEDVDDEDPEAEWGDEMYCRQAGK